jgi:hypothetical protein
MSDQWLERAQAAEALLKTQKESLGAAIERIKDFKKNFGIREKSDGSIEIDFDKFAQNLGVESCIELRRVIDDKYKISGKSGEKPRMKIVS